MFAVIEEGSKQYLVKKGDVVFVEKVEAQVNEVIKLSKTLLVEGGCGDVMATVLEHKKTDKVIIFKKKRRHNYRRKNGHRQQITVLRITDILRS